MRVFVDGVEVVLSDTNEYALGPLRLFVRTELAQAYNRVIHKIVEAQTYFEIVFGIPWEPVFDKNVVYDIDPDDLKIFIGLKFAIEEVASFYDGPVESLDLDYLCMIPIDELW